MGGMLPRHQETLHSDMLAHFLFKLILMYPLLPYDFGGLALWFIW